jgi:DNA-binding IclR family transcriptional regulator
MSERGDADSGLKTAARVFDIIETVRERDEVGVTELAEELGMAKSTVHGYLTTIERAGYLTKDDGKYQLSLKYLDHGIYKRNQSIPWDVVSQTLKQLADETSEIAWFTVEENGRALDIYKSEGDRAITIETWLGQAKPVHALAAGKAILAFESDEYVREVIDRHGLETFTDNTITTEAEFLEELETVREEGVAFNDEEYTRGIRSVGAPVLVDGDVVGAVNLSGPANRMKGERFHEDLPNLILGAANEIELKLQARN